MKTAGKALTAMRTLPQTAPAALDRVPFAACLRDRCEPLVVVRRRTAEGWSFEPTFRVDALGTLSRARARR